MAEQSSASAVAAYRLTDQFGRVHDRAAVVGRPALYVVATRQGTGLLAEWTRGLRTLAMAPETGGAAVEDASHGSVAVIPVVAIAGVPPFLRGAVCRLLPRDPEAWALVDFEGTLAMLAEPEAPCTVTVVDAAGAVRARTVVAPFRPEDAAALLAVARAG